MNRFIKIFFLSFAIFILLAALGTIGYVQVASSNIVKQLTNNPITSKGDGQSIGDLIDEGEASYLNSKKITTVALFGVDKDGYRTDVNMLVFFHHETAEIDIVSIPRDTKVRIPDDIFAEINLTRSGVKQNDRINSIPAYVSSQKRNETSVAVIEEVFGVDVDYYVNMDLDGFKYIVDAVGKIPVDVPMDMEYTDMASDPPLIINLKAGYQELNGAQAEQLIRYRYGYSNADIGRIETQHAFMKSFVNELLKPEKRFNMISIVETVLVKMTTDFNDAVDYLIYLDDLSPDKITMTTFRGSRVLTTAPTSMMLPRLKPFWKESSTRMKMGKRRPRPYRIMPVMIPIRNRMTKGRPKRPLNRLRNRSSKLNWWSLSMWLSSGYQY